MKMRKRYRILLLLVLMTAPALAQNALPVDVTRFVEKRDSCDHFRGEEAYDAERGKFLEEQMRKLRTGTDKKLKALKAKYRKNPGVLSRLKEYEPQIE